MGRRLSWKALLKRLTLLCPFAVLLGLYSWQTSILTADPIQSEIPSDEAVEWEEEKNIPAECQCRDNDTDLVYNFCYRLMDNSSTRGSRFSCEHLPTAVKLGLVAPRGYVRLKNGEFPQPVMVTAASDSHISESLRLIGMIHSFMPHQKIVFYDLGGNEKNSELRSACNLEYRKFDYSRYPASVKDILSYRWKPILIAEALLEFGALWYMDSSVVFFKGNLSHVYQLLKCRAGNTDNITIANLVSQAELHESKFIPSGFHVDRWLTSIHHCDKFAYLLHGFTGHGIYSATHPGVYKFIPTNEDMLKKENAKMFEAGFALAVRSVEVISDLLKWYVLCALEPGCMGPPGAQLGCRFTGDRYGDYAHCHRFDQSVVNLLLANRNQYDSYYYTSGIVDFFKIVRGGAPESNMKPQMCPSTSTTV